MIHDIIVQIKKELEQYKYPYNHRAKLLSGIIYLLEDFDEMSPEQS